MSKKLYFGLFLIAALVFTVLISSGTAAAISGCSSTPTDKGTATTTVNITSTGTYVVWSRIKASAGGNDSYMLKIDGQCVTVGNNGLTADQWEWTNHDADAGAPTILDLNAGNHSVTMAGLEENVGVDRVLFLTDLACVPSGSGDNCAVDVDNVVPSVSIISPSDGATVSDTVAINATATDDSAVDKVEFYIDGSRVSTDTSAPYSHAWATNVETNGSHTINVIAYDTSGNTASKSINVNVNNTVVAGDATMTIAGTNTNLDIGQTYTFTISVDSGNNDMDSALARVLYDPTKLQYVSTDFSNSSFETTTPNEYGSNYVELARSNFTPLTGNQEFARVSFKALSNLGTTALTLSSTESAVLNLGTELDTTFTDANLAVVDVTAPTAPVNLQADVDSTSSVGLSWSASSDNHGVDGYIVERDGTQIADGVASTSFNDTQVQPGDSYDYQVQGVDLSGNTSAKSNVATATLGVKPGDFNDDSNVDIYDLAIMIGDWKTAGPNGTDLNSDGIVNIYDLSILVGYWGT